MRRRVLAAVAVASLSFAVVGQADRPPVGSLGTLTSLHVDAELGDLPPPPGGDCLSDPGTSDDCDDGLVTSSTYHDLETDEARDAGVDTGGRDAGDGGAPHSPDVHADGDADGDADEATRDPRDRRDAEEQPRPGPGDPEAPGDAGAPGDADEPDEADA